MQIKSGLEDEYANYKKKNGPNADPVGYSYGVIKFTERWAELMEAAITNGAKLEDVAKQCSRSADTEGITGFMYGCAAAALAHFWVYGEQFRLWHNLDTQIGTEGEAANKSGGILNPALLHLESN